MLDPLPRHHSLRTHLYLGLVGISLAFAVASYGLRYFVEMRISEQAEAQIRALNRYRSQQSLMATLLDEEVGLRGFLGIGDVGLLGSYYQGIKVEAEAFRSTLENLDPSDQEEARLRVDRLQGIIRGWHEDVADPLVRRRRVAPLPNLKGDLEAEKRSFEAIREASDSLLRFLDERDNARLEAVEASLGAARWMSGIAMLVMFFLGLSISRWILRKIADPLIELADAARLGAGFPEPESIHSVREVEVLGQALFELDIRAREREQTLLQDQEEAQAIREFTELVQRIDREEDLLAALEQALRRRLEVDLVQVLLRPSVGDGLQAALPLEMDETGSRMFEDAMACRAMQKGSSVQLDSKAPTACLCALGVPGRGAYLCIPLVASGQILGLVNLQSRRPGHFTPKLCRIAEACISIAASALQALRALHLAKDQAIRDGLTGIYNRRFLDEILGKLVDQARRGAQSLSALMLDIDHFKQFNDQFGHEAGDQVLRAVVRCLREQVRGGDVVARYGGEEFAILLPFTAFEVALIMADRLRLCVEALSLPEPDFPAGCRVTVSIGVATFPEHGSDGETLMASADKALYGAKGNGRNQVVGFPALGL